MKFQPGEVSPPNQTSFLSMQESAECFANHGQVFKALLPEPAGGNLSNGLPFSEEKELADRYGGTITAIVGRFIVVANDAGHCSCL